MNDDQIKQATTMLERLAEVKCSHCFGKGLEPYSGNPGDYSPEPCGICETSCIDPRTEMFRVTCEHTLTPGMIDPETLQKHIASCTGTRPLTIAEAEAKGLEMLEWLFKEGHDEIFWDGWDVQDMPLLLAILAAVSAAVGVVDTSCKLNI